MAYGHCGVSGSVFPISEEQKAEGWLSEGLGDLVWPRAVYQSRIGSSPDFLLLLDCMRNGRWGMSLVGDFLLDPDRTKDSYSGRLV